jgi:hypothetical protein
MMTQTSENGSIEPVKTSETERKLPRYQIVEGPYAESSGLLVELHAEVLRDDVKRPRYGDVTGHAYTYLTTRTARALAKALVAAAREAEVEAHNRESKEVA